MGPGEGAGKSGRELLLQFMVQAGGGGRWSREKHAGPNCDLKVEPILTMNGLNVGLREGEGWRLALRFWPEHQVTSEGVELRASRVAICKGMVKMVGESRIELMGVDSRETQLCFFFLRAVLKGVQKIDHEIQRVPTSSLSPHSK